MNRKHMALLAVCLLLGVLSAPAFAEDITVTVWGWWDIRMELFAQVARDFEAENPGIKIQVETLANMWEKALPAVASGTGPTLLLGKIGNYYQFLERGVLEPYPEEYSPESWVEEEYPHVPWESLKYKGRYYVFPGGFMGDLLMYNKKHFSEVGLDPSKPPQTWDELITAAKRLTKRDSTGFIVRAGFVPGHEYPFLTYTYQLGGNIVELRENKPPLATMNTPEVVEALRFLTDFYTKHQVVTSGFPDWGEAIGTEKASMTIGESFIIGEWMINYPDVFGDIDYASPPTPTGEWTPYTGRKSTLLLLMANARRPEKEKDAAMKFLKYIYRDTDKLAKSYAQLMMAAPAKRSLFDDPDILKIPGMQVLLQTLPFQKDAVELDPATLQPLMDNAVDRVIIDGMTPEQSLAIANTELQQYFDDGLMKYIQ